MKLFVFFIFLLCPVYSFGQIDVNSVLSDVVSLRTQNKCDEAIAKLNKAIETKEKNAWLYIERARCFRELKNNEAVVSNVKAAFRLNPKDKKILEVGAFELRASGQSALLIEIADSLIAEDETNSAAYEIRSLNKIFLKNFAGAIDDYLKFSELDPLSAHGRIGIVLDSLKDLKDDKSVLAYYIRVMSFYEKLVKDLNDRLETETNSKLNEIRLKDALTKYGTMLHGLSMNLAELYFANGETEKAKQVLNKMIQIEPKTLAYGYRFNYYKQKKMYEEAAEDFTTYSELTGKVKNTPKLKAKFYVERGDLYVLAQKYEKAIADYELAIMQDQEISAEANEKISLAKLKLQK